ncbi:MAG TPA: hypothetical protein VHY81_03920 [Acidimicrobiales bacterium]|nr:hypothetical protein [Acidimicrobiales bacterium]
MSLYAGSGRHPKCVRERRHTYASALIASGCSVKVVQANLCHKSAVMTLDIYSHLWPQDDDRARDAVLSFFGSGVSSVCHDQATGSPSSRSEPIPAQMS